MIGAEESTTRRLNPFAFPSDTTFRFVLLIGAIIGVGLFSFDWMYTILRGGRVVAQGLLDCSAILTDLTQLDAYRECMVALQTPRLAFGVVGIVLTLGLAVALYLYGFAQRRRRFTPFRADDAPQVGAELSELSTEIGLTHGPEYLWEPLDPRLSGVAFGAPGRRAVGLSGGLIVQAGTDLAAFRAVVLHELAHLRNRDVDLAHYAVAITRVFLAIAVLPLAVITIVTTDTTTILGIAWRLAILVALVYLIRNGLVRARELDADVRASSHEPAISRVLGAASGPTRSRFASLMRLHPPLAERLAAIRDPGRLMRLALVDAFLVGVVGTLAYDDVATILSYYRFDAFAYTWLATLAFSPLVAAIVVAGTWRATFVALARGTRVRHGIAAGVALAAGFLVGQYISLTAAIFPDPVVLAGAIDLADIVLVAFAVLGAILFVSWAATTAALWLPRTARWASPRRAIAAAILVGALILSVGTALFILLTKSRELLSLLGDSLTAGTSMLGDIWVGPAWFVTVLIHPAVTIFTSEPLVIVAVLLTVLFPMAAIVGTPKQGAAPASWAVLDPGDPSPHVEWPRASIRLPVLAGLIGASVLLLVLLLGRLWLRSALSAEERALEDFELVARFWTRAAVVLGSIVVAGAVAVRARAFGTTQALAAAVLVCVIGIAGVTAIQAAVPCTPGLSLRDAPFAACALPDLTFYWEHFSAILVPASIAAVMVAGPLAYIRERLRGDSPAP